MPYYKLIDSLNNKYDFHLLIDLINNLSIDVDHTFCPYCKTILSALYLKHNNYIDKYECNSCNEIIEYYIADNNVFNICFSCKDIMIRFDEFVNFIIMDRKDYSMSVDDSNLKIIIIPSFDILFDDKNKLYDKFKTYVLFS